MEKYSFLQIQTSPTSHVSSESSHHWQPTHQSPTPCIQLNCETNLITKMRKKLQKNKKNIQKKVVTAGELFIAGALLMAGGNMVDKLSDDSSPQITASEVTWTEDKGKALFEIKTVQRDSGFSAWGASRYIMLALGVILLAILAIKAIQ